MLRQIANTHQQNIHHDRTFDLTSDNHRDEKTNSFYGMVASLMKIEYFQIVVFHLLLHLHKKLSPLFFIEDLFGE